MALKDGKIVKILYHGTNFHFDEFDESKLCSDCSIDQYGSGFYFFDSPAPTIRYGNIIVECSVEICKIVEVNDPTYLSSISKMNIERLLLASPSLDDRLNNIDDVEYTGFDNVLKQAIALYSTKDVLHTLNCIGNDFYEKEDTYILLKKFAEITGYNCVRDSKSGIWNILTKKQITILAHKTMEDYG